MIRCSDKKMIEAFEMWCYRRMMKIRWVDLITTEEVVNQILEKRSFWHILIKRRDRLVGHILRHQGIVNLALEGSVWGKNRRGRPRDEYSKQIQNDEDCRTYFQMKRLAQDRVSWRAASNKSAD